MIQTYLTPAGLRELAEDGRISNQPTRFSFIHLRQLADRIESLERGHEAAKISMHALGSTMVHADQTFENAYDALVSIGVVDRAETVS